MKMVWRGVIATLGGMPWKIIEFVSTPNPNAMKCVLDVPLGSGTRSYFSAASAAGDAHAAALFAIEGVTNVLIHESGWVTVSKSPDVAWPALKKKIERTLAGM